MTLIAIFAAIMIGITAVIRMLPPRVIVNVGIITSIATIAPLSIAVFAGLYEAEFVLLTIIPGTETLYNVLYRLFDGEIPLVDLLMWGMPIAIVNAFFTQAWLGMINGEEAGP